MNLPLQIYDFLAILLPAAVLVSISKYEFGQVPICQDSTSNSGIAMTLISLYLVGLVLSIISNRLEKWRITAWIFSGKKINPREDQIVLNGRKKPVVLSKKIGDAVLSSLTDFYGFTINKDDPNIFELAYSPVYERMAKREVFLSLSNMCRSLSIIGLACTVFYAVKLIFPGLQEDSTLLQLIFSIAGFIAFREIYIGNSYLSELIPYSAFLAWYQEMKMQKG